MGKICSNCGKELSDNAKFCSKCGSKCEEVVQEKKVKMVFLKDGSKETGGYAPYASRFTDGAYIHGVPVNAPRKTQIEYSPSFGTTPRSHMCVRNATSHAKFIYDWAPVNETIIFVLE